MDTQRTDMNAFGVDGRHCGGVTVLRAAGRLVAGAGAGHPVWQAREWRGAARLVVELDAVTALDAGGVGALLRLRQHAGRHGVPVEIASAAPRVRRVLELTRLDRVFGLPATPAPPVTSPRPLRRGA
jgi:anti-anti-sigma factor